MIATPHPSTLLDLPARRVVDRLHAIAQRQRRDIIRHYLPRLPGFLLGRSLSNGETDRAFFDDKLIPLDPAQGDLIYLLARARAARTVVEFGTSFGVSTLYLAAAVRDAGTGGKVIGTEIVPSKAAAARKNLADAGLADHVELREGDARQTLAHLEPPVDFLLLDGWPQLAGEILSLVEPKLAPGAIVVVDNVSQFGRELGSVVARLGAPPFVTTRLPLNGATLVSVFAG